MLNFIKKIYLWLAPYTCTLCLHPAERADLCASCYALLPKFTQSDNQHTLEPFQITHALFTYDTPITKMIMQLKFHQQLVYARIFGELMSDAIQKHWYYNKTLPELIIPVPLHAKRLKERGYNQALEISRPISRLLNIPILANNVVRSKETDPQAKLPRDKRRYNMKNAFKIKNKFQAKHIAVLDDVITTGETIKSLCQVLTEEGVEKIDVWCCARTIFL